MEVNILKNNTINSVTIFFQESKNTMRGHLIGIIAKGGKQLDPVTFTCIYHEYIILTHKPR